MSFSWCGTRGTLVVVVCLEYSFAKNLHRFGGKVLDVWNAKTLYVCWMMTMTMVEIRCFCLVIRLPTFFATHSVGNSEIAQFTLFANHLDSGSLRCVVIRFTFYNSYLDFLLSFFLIYCIFCFVLLLSVACGMCRMSPASIWSKILPLNTSTMIINIMTPIWPCVNHLEMR